jgi:phosphatidylserine/phosphatidylglycerophosphate/cardiolipin synthase-like enzyme
LPEEVGYAADMPTLALLILACLMAPLLAQESSGESPERAAYFTLDAADPTAVPRALVQILDQAAKSIDLAMLRLDHPLVLEGLMKAHRRGVRVRVLTDDALLRYRFRDAFEMLKREGVRVQTDRGDPFNVNMHHKFAVVDERWTWTGDWNATVADTETSAHSAICIDDGSLAGVFRAAFESLWEGRPQGVGTEVPGQGMPLKLEGGGHARVYFGFSNNLSHTVVEELLRAKHTLDIAHLLFQEPRVALAVLHLVQRGVRVRILTSDAGRRPRWRETMARFAVPLREGTGTKFFIVDRKTLILGSWNCTVDLDHENILVLEDCKQVIDAFQAWFDQTFGSTAEESYFLKEGHADLHPVDRWRSEVLLGSPPAEWRLVQPLLTSRLELERVSGSLPVPVEPRLLHVNPKEALAGERVLGVSFVTVDPNHNGVRWVLSAARLEKSEGNYLTPSMRPVIFGEDVLGESVGMVPFRMEFPESDAYSLDLDGFIRVDGMWRWAARYSVPAFVVLVAPWVTVDDDSTRAISSAILKPLQSWNRYRCDVTSEGLLSAGPGARILSPPVQDLARLGSTLELHASCQGDGQMLLQWGADRPPFPEENQIAIPLVADGKRHRYLVDLAAIPAWSLNGQTSRLQIVMGRDGRGIQVFDVGLGQSRMGNPHTQGTYRKTDGTPETCLTINGESGSEGERFWLRPGDEVTLGVRTPLEIQTSAPYALLIRAGVPAPSESHSLKPFGIDAQIPILPTSLGGTADVRVLAGSLDEPWHVGIRTSPAPCSFVLRVPAYPSGTELYLQPVFLGAHPGVGRAAVIRIR